MEEEGLCHKFVLDDYAMACKGIDDVNDPIESAQFYAGRYRWAISFYPDATEVDVSKSGYSCLSVTLKSEKSKPFHWNLYELYVHDQSLKDNHLGRCMYKGVRDILYQQQFGKRELPTSPDYIFINRELLESPDYLKDDRLIIWATIGVFASEKIYQSCQKNQLSFIYIHPPPPFTILVSKNDGLVGSYNGEDLDFGRLLESKEGADVFFRVADERICAHKSVVAYRSLVLRQLFSDKEIVITDVEPGIFKAMLWFMYTGELLEEKQGSSPRFVAETFLEKMLAAADKYRLESLKRLCEYRILELKDSGPQIQTSTWKYLLASAKECLAAVYKLGRLGRTLDIEKKED